MDITDPMILPENPGREEPTLPPEGRDDPRLVTPCEPAVSKGAGFIRRAVAFLIDFILIELLYFILVGIGVSAMRFSTGRHGELLLSEELLSALATPFVAVWFFLFIGYFTFFHAYDGQTPAKIIVRIKVVDEEGKTLSLGRALARSFGYFLSTLFFGFGFFLSIFERKNRALHDFLARSQVVLS